MANKLTKFFRVAVEGATTDRRQILRDWIVQMANNFDPAKYGARIWLEHLRGTLPDSPFRAYGDVVALKAEEIEIGGVKKMALFAQVDPTEDLIKMTKARQKIYTSIEINDNFADTGEAYLIGLGVTDSPASLGTEMLAFAVQHPDANPLKGRKSSPDTMFSELLETTIEFDGGEGESQSLAAKVKAMLKKFTVKNAGDEAKFADVNEAVETMLEHVVKLDEQTTSAFSELKQRNTELEAKITAADNAFAELKGKLDNEPGNQPARPTATGGKGEQQTDC